MRLLLALTLYTGLVAAGAVVLADAYTPVSAAKKAVGSNAQSLAAPPDRTASNAEAENRIAVERAERAARRAYYTAPPVVPHELFPASAGDCLTCHRQEGIYFGKVSPVTPHPHLTSCNQCHLPSRPYFSETTADPVETSWKGLEAPLEGTRAHVVAPPTVPHRIFLRESCLTCHSAQSPYDSLRCPHPERSSCTQCHVASDNAAFRLESELHLPSP